MHPSVIERVDAYIRQEAASMDPATQLICGHYLERYLDDEAYLDEYFDSDAIDERSLRSFRESIAYAYYLLANARHVDQANAIIATVLQAQVREAGHPDFGKMRWFYEEKKIRDGNANFFIAAPLLLIQEQQAQRLTRPNRDGIRQALQDLIPVFDHEHRRCSLTYVNPTLGITSIRYLLANRYDTGHATVYRQDLLDYLDFLLSRGINESYTPTYYGVSAIILFMVLALDDHDEVHARIWQLLLDVMLAEKAFFADRFPAPFRRGYNHTYSGRASDIFSALLSYLTVCQPEHYDPYLPCLALPLMLQIEADHDVSWPESPPAPRRMRGKVFDDCWAESYLTKDYLLGSFNHFPPITAVWQTAATGGAGWQDGCFFFSTTSADDVTGMLRLEAMDEHGKDTYHPIREPYSRDAANWLFPFLSFPPEPKVRTLQHNDTAVCLFKIDRVDARLRRLGFNLLFSRFHDRAYDRELRPLSLSETPLTVSELILELPQVWVCLFPLQRVDMGRSSLLEAAFLPPAFELFRSKEGLNCSMYHYQGACTHFIQNHIAGGFVLCLRSRQDIPDKQSLRQYLSGTQVEERWESAQINAHIDLRDAIRTVSFADGRNTLSLAWDHYTDQEVHRLINGQPQTAPASLREISRC